ncbi:MAG: hypothetical protein HY237_13295 [Acidobacteria bacterium]|nr:hypothetical protein [Acidobacteriota bacterium]
MKKTLFLTCALCLFLSGAVQALAQTPAPGAPPKVLTIFREEVKVGKGAVHEKFETNFVKASAKAKWPTHYLAITSMSGSSEAWYITPFDSFAAWEKDQKATEKNAAFTAELEKLAEQDAAFINNGRSIVAIYREDLSYHADTMGVSKARYLEVETVRVRLGRSAEFVEMEKISIAAHDKANIGEHWACYQVVEGAPAGTYLFFSAMKSLAEADVDHGKAVNEAMGEENVKKRRKFAAEGIQFVESNLFALSPKMSYVSKEWAAADPDFWTPKAKAAGKAPAAEKKEGAAKEAAKPAPPAKKAGGQAPAKKQ